ncbi:hypothetical protein B484DRAFT_445799 [Ochromonadaceae sp. CCMP2298]|nr:hypothetical protein B484DRAFT_445799 [Ochromonadaceae sp. CCMP2298]
MSTERGMELVDEGYEIKMAGFEVDCADGKGEPIACHHVGEFYSVVKEEFTRSAAVYLTNCKNGYGPSCFNAGRMHLAGKGVEQDDTKATELFQKSCKSGHLQGCYLNGLMLYNSCLEKEKADKATASSVGASSGASSSAPASASAAVSAPAPVVAKTWAEQARERTEQAKEKRDKTEALKLFDWACKEGENDSCYFAASHYLKKDAPDRDPTKALHYLTQSCGTNHAPSCFNLAVMFKHGDLNVPADAEKFAEYKGRTDSLVAQLGGLGGTRTA